MNLMGTESGIPDLTAGTSLPVLQDKGESNIAGCFGASKWYLYVVDREGFPRHIHYQLNLDSERNRLFLELATLATGGK